VEQEGMMSRPIFILSDFRTGSTLLRYVLDTHPAVCCPAEIRLGAFCQHTFNFVELLTAEAPGRMDSTEQQERLRMVRRVVDDLMTDYCSRKRKQRWCDKSPANTEVLYVLDAVFPDAQYVCLHRHGLDQVRSVLEAEGSTRLQPYLARHRGDLVSAAIERWCARTEKLLAFEHGHQGTVKRVTYEGFIKDPEAELLGLMQFLQLEIVSGLSLKAFERPHDRGPADPKISQTKGVEHDRIGRGRKFDLSKLSTELCQRFEALMEGLGYSCETRTSGP
jgi:protein-tyrosine sulfotransferase